jgi:hypothetical protein
VCICIFTHALHQGMLHICYAKVARHAMLVMHPWPQQHNCTS